MNEIIRQKIADRINGDLYANHLGIKFEKIEEGLVEARLSLSDTQRQYCGVAHGGVLASLADAAAGFAAYTMTPEDKEILTVELKISYLRPAWGNELIAKGSVVKAGKNVHFSECEIYCEGKLVSKASATFCVINKPV